MKLNIIRFFSTGVRKPPHVCVVGTGPAGFYSAKYLLQNFNNLVKVDFIDKCYYPYGLLRYGVAPDHPEVRNATHEFDHLCPKIGSTHCRFFGGITVVRDQSAIQHLNSRPFNKKLFTPLDINPLLTQSVDYDYFITLRELQESYDAVLLATGAGESVRLSIEGNTLKGIISAGDFVKWYNGFAYTFNEENCQTLSSHKKQIQPFISPIINCEYPTLGPGGSYSTVKQLIKRLTILNSTTLKVLKKCIPSSRVLIIGHGNVALDIARILLKDMSNTLIDPVAYNGIKLLNVQSISIVGRRRLQDASFSPAELRELVSLPNIHKNLPQHHQLELLKMDSLNRREKKLLHIFMSVPNEKTIMTSDLMKQIEFLTELCPRRYLPKRHHPSWIGGVEFEDKNGTSVYLPADLVIESVGFKQSSTTDCGLPLTANKKSFVTEHGQVTIGQESCLAKVYAVGWCQNGAQGTIASTISEAKWIADRMKHDYHYGYWKQ